MITEYKATAWKNLPDKSTPINATNLNKIEDGLETSTVEINDVLKTLNDQIANTKGEDGKSAYESWKLAGNVGTEEEFVASLKGAKGDAGKDGKDGLDGKSFHIDGTVEKLGDLPDPTTVEDQYWVSYEFGHLHYSDGTAWRDVGQFAGVEGREGAKGEKGKDFDVTNSPAPIGSIAVMQVDGWKAFTRSEIQEYMSLPKYYDADLSGASATAEIPLGDDLQLYLMTFSALTAIVLIRALNKDTRVGYAYELGTLTGNADEMFIKKDGGISLTQAFHLNKPQELRLLVTQQDGSTYAVSVISSFSGKRVAVRVDKYGEL